MTARIIRITACLVFGLLVPLCARAQDPAPYARLLGDCLRGKRVDYVCVKSHGQDLDAYLDSLARTSARELSPAESLAYFINAYNAWTLKLVANHYPVASIKDIGPFWSTPWKIDFVRLDGKTVSLDYLEHDVLRPRFKDPRVHFAINCASASCPPLRPSPYEAGRISAELDEAARAFINDPASNRLDGETLYLSRIFHWFSEDFGGEKGVLAFVARYAEGDLRTALLDGRAPRIEYLEYDWSLNAAKDGTDGESAARE